MNTTTKALQALQDLDNKGLLEALWHADTCDCDLTAVCRDHTDGADQAHALRERLLDALEATAEWTSGRRHHDLFGVVVIGDTRVFFEATNAWTTWREE